MKRTEADPFGASDVHQAARSFARGITDALGGTDVSASVLLAGLSLAVGDGIGLSDLSTFRADRRSTFGDPLGFGDGHIRAFQYRRSASEALGLLDTQAAARDVRRAAADGLGALDASVASFLVAFALADGLAPRDRAEFLLIVGRTFVEAHFADVVLLARPRMLGVELLGKPGFSEADVLPKPTVTVP